jgi:hypothetical protein
MRTLGSRIFCLVLVGLAALATTEPSVFHSFGAFKLQGATSPRSGCGACAIGQREGGDAAPPLAVAAGLVLVVAVDRRRRRSPVGIVGMKRDRWV